MTATTLKRVTLSRLIACWPSVLLLLVVTATTTTNAMLLSASHLALAVRAFAAQLQYQQLPHGHIIFVPRSGGVSSSALRLSAAGRAALMDLLSQRQVSVGQLDDAKHQPADRLGVLLLTTIDDTTGGGDVGASMELCMGKHSIYDSRWAWLVVPPSSVATARLAVWTERAFRRCNVGVDADITLAVYADGSQSPALHLFDVHSVCGACGQPLRLQAKGNWTSGRGWQLSEEYRRRSAVRRRSNFGGLTLRAATAILEKPAELTNLTHLTNERDNKQLDTMQRKTYQLLKLLEPMWHVRFEVLFEDVWGARRNGSWTGVLGALVRGRADLSMCPLRYTRERIADVHFAPDLHVENIPFIFRHPRRNAIRNIFFEPLSTAAWWCVAALVGVATLLLAVQTRLAAPAGEQRRWDFVALTVAEACLLQGPDPGVYRRTSMRLLVAGVCLFSYLLLQFYGGFIVGSLLALPTRSITTLRALYNSSLLLGMEDVPYNYEIFENATSAFVRQLYARRICRPPRAEHITSIERGAERIQRGGYAFHVSANRMLYLLKSQLSDDEFCDLQQINLAPPYQASVALPKRSPYREHLAAAVLQLRSAGLLRRNDALWRPSLTDCQLQQQSREVVVDLEHFAPALIFLAAAHLLAVCVAMLECVAHRCRRG